MISVCTNHFFKKIEHFAYELLVFQLLTSMDYRHCHYNSSNKYRGSDVVKGKHVTKSKIRIYTVLKCDILLMMA